MRGLLAAALFPSPLIKPDVPVSGIRLSDRLYHQLTEGFAHVMRRRTPSFPNTTVESWVTMLSSRLGGEPIAVAVEQSPGARVFMLSKYEHLHLYPIHPCAAAQFRAALYPSGAKDDPVDADLLPDLLVHHRPHLRRLNPNTEQTRLIRHLVEARRKLVNEKTRQTNRLTAQLKLYFPQILDWLDSVDSRIVGDWLRRWPTLETLTKGPRADSTFISDCAPLPESGAD